MQLQLRRSVLSVSATLPLLVVVVVVAVVVVLAAAAVSHQVHVYMSGGTVHPDRITNLARRMVVTPPRPPRRSRPIFWHGTRAALTRTSFTASFA